MHHYKHYTLLCSALIMANPHSLSTVTSTFILLFLFATVSYAHNITKILAKHPEFSTFNHYLTLTHLAGEINRRETITVLALDNAAMTSLLAKGLSVYTLKNVLSFHVLVDYFGSKKLHQLTDGSALASTIFQASGAAPGSTGYVNITNLKAGKVGFGTEDNGGKLNALYVKSVEELPYNISVIQISQSLNSAEAEAPTAAPTILNLTAILSGKQGCKAFADLLGSSGAMKTFNDNVDGGLTVLCPSDAAVESFMPKYKNLTAARKTAVLLYHGFPVYQSLQDLKSNNGVMNTLATNGPNKYDFTVQNDGDDVKLMTKVITATITGTVKDEEPLVVYKIDKVLLPRELFKEVAMEPAPAPTTHKKTKKKSKDSPAADSPADGPGSDDSDDSADSTADDNGVARMNGKSLLIVMGAIALWLGVAVL